jgi:hypothetical protein
MLSNSDWPGPCIYTYTHSKFKAPLLEILLYAPKFKTFLLNILLYTPSRDGSSRDRDRDSQDRGRGRLSTREREREEMRSKGSYFMEIREVSCDSLQDLLVSFDRAVGCYWHSGGVQGTMHVRVLCAHRLQRLHAFAFALLSARTSINKVCSFEAW